MNRKQAEKITVKYLKPIYGFALKRCANLQDAEDLTQEIVLKAFHALLVWEDIESTDKFIWTVAHNTLANYYRDKTKRSVGIPIDELAETLPSDDDTSAEVAEKESAERLHMEIAYLSKLQRRIVIAYYFYNERQEAISKSLNIPLGTVKWHLFEAKKELKRGMEIMRQPSELKFNPIKFDLCGTNGSPGTKGANNNFFRSALSQNIVYSTWKEAKTVNEIAANLGVSPVYVESEAEYLAQYGFLIENKRKYLCNILLDEATDSLIEMHDKLYQQAAKVFVNELYDELVSCGILEDERIICGQVDQSLSSTGEERPDDNFLLWSLIPYISAISGESLMDKRISFDEAATIRPDGGHNICYASVITQGVKPPMYFESMLHFCGPCWNANEDYTLWQIDSEWSTGRIFDGYISKCERVLSMLSNGNSGILKEENLTYLAEMGFIKAGGSNKSVREPSWQIVRLHDTQIKLKLIAIGDKIKENHWNEFEAMKADYIKAVLDETPKHLQKMQKYGLQFLFFSDGWFVLHCIKELVESGKLKPPTEEQKKSLTTILIPNN